MKAILMMFDSLNRHFLPNYGCNWTKLPNFERLSRRCCTFDNFYGGSMPCMPARRELHTGRYNFLHRSWSPLEPYDDSVFERLRKAGIYTHITTDHFHYWEDGGSCYLTKYDSFEMVRGQQGDPWKGRVARPKYPETLSHRTASENWRHDWINRAFLTDEDKMPQKRNFDVGLDFIDGNKDQDNWFLQIECFDPHEPFFTQQEYKNLYPHEYDGKQLDWPDYGKNELTSGETQHVRFEYAALLSMCDRYLGKLLDRMDRYDLWKDTMLIVNTDHGFMLGEKEWMGKNQQPFYNELVHLPFFLHDPRFPGADGCRRQALAQTVDLPPTLAEFFGAEPPEHRDGVSLTPIVSGDEKIREGALFGIHGGQVNVTDGRYVYMRAAVNSRNQPLYEYTLMPCHMAAPFRGEELKDAVLTDQFGFTGGTPLMKLPARSGHNTYWYGSRLYDLERDPEQEHPSGDREAMKRMILLMRSLMKKNEAPDEQYQRLGIPKDGPIGDEVLAEPEKTYEKPGDHRLHLEKKAEKAAAIYLSTQLRERQDAFVDAASAECIRLGRPLSLDEVLDCIRRVEPPRFRENVVRSVKNMLD